MNFSYIFVTLLILACVSAQRQQNGRPGKNTLQAFNLCRGQSVDLSSKLQNFDSCIDNRLQQIQQLPDGGIQKAVKKKANLAKRLKIQCASDCEWVSTGLIPESFNGTAYTYMQTNADEFLKLFPPEAQSTMGCRIQACFDTTSATPLKEGKPKNLVKQVCSRNKRLIKCLQKSLRQVCRRNGTPQPSTSPTSSTEFTNATSVNVQQSVSVTEGISTSPSFNSTVDSTVSRTEDENDDNENDDDEKDDENEKYQEEPTTTLKTSVPETFVNTSERITR